MARTQKQMRPQEPLGAEKQLDWYPKLDEADKLKRYKSRVAWAEQATQRDRQQAEMFIEYYRNKPQMYTKGGQRVVVPTAIKNVDAMFAALTAFEVTPVVTPKGLTTLDMARVQESGLRNEWDELEVAETAEYAIKESLVVGLGFVKLGYEFEEEEYENDVPEEEATQETQVDTATVKDNATVEHIPYDELFFDPEAKKWDDVTWVCQKYELPLEQVKADPDFRNTEDISASSWLNNKFGGGATKKLKAEMNPDDERVILYQMHDLVRGIVCTYAEDHDHILREQPGLFSERGTYRKRNPFVSYMTRKDIGKVWGISDVKAMKPAIDEQNVLRSSLATWVERAKPKIMADDGVFTEQGKRALKSQEWGEVVELRAGAVMAQSVRPFDIPSIPQEAFAQDSKAAADADASIGMNSLLGAELPVGRKSATAMNQLGQSTTIRQAEKRNALGRFYGEIADKLLYIMQTYYEQDRMTRMVEDMGDVVWDWNNEDIAFESSITIGMEPKEVMDAETKREKYLAMLNILGADPAINRAALMTYVLKDGLGIPAEVVRTLVKTEEAVAEEQQAAHQQEMELKATGPQQAEIPPELLDQASAGGPATAGPGII